MIFLDQRAVIFRGECNYAVFLSYKSSETKIPNDTRISKLPTILSVIIFDVFRESHGSLQNYRSFDEKIKK